MLLSADKNYDIALRSEIKAVNVEDEKESKELLG